MKENARIRRIVTLLFVLGGFSTLLWGATQIDETLMVAVEVIVLCDIVFTGASWINGRTPLFLLCAGCWLILVVPIFWWLMATDALTRFNGGIAILAFSFVLLKLPYNITVFNKTGLRIFLTVCMSFLVILLTLVMADNTSTDLIATLTSKNGIGAIAMMTFTICATVAMYLNLPPTWIFRLAPSK